jgi:hypothetical protein
MPYKDPEAKKRYNKEYQERRKAEGYVRPKRNRTEYRKAYYESNKDKLKEDSNNYYHANKESLKPKRLKTAQEYRAKNKTTLLERARKYAKENKAAVKERMRTYRQNNKGKINARTRQYQLRKMQRTPVWLTEDQYWMLEEAYTLAVHRSDTTGVKWHVDHVIPLHGKTASGLHVPWNIQVITGVDNIRKSNLL